MKSPQMIKNENIKSNVISHIEAEFEKADQSATEIYLTIPESWSSEELLCADQYLKEWGWDSEITRSITERKIKIFPLYFISQDEMDIIKAKDIFTQSQLVNIKNSKWKILKDNNYNPYEEIENEKGVYENPPSVSSVAK